MLARPEVNEQGGSINPQMLKFQMWLIAESTSYHEEWWINISWAQHSIETYSNVKIFSMYTWKFNSCLEWSDDLIVMTVGSRLIKNPVLGTKQLDSCAETGRRCNCHRRKHWSQHQGWIRRRGDWLGGHSAFRWSHVDYWRLENELKLQLGWHTSGTLLRDIIALKTSQASPKTWIFFDESQIVNHLTNGSKMIIQFTAQDNHTIPSPK